MKTAVVVAALMTLAGCQAVPMASTPRSIAFQGGGPAFIADATLKAQVHCQQWQRDAEIVNDGGQTGSSSFRCVDRQK